MDYLKYEDEINGYKGFTYLEIEEGYALRQIFKSDNYYIASNRRNEEYDFCMAEGFIDVEELECNIINISDVEFYDIWSRYLKSIQKQWDDIKLSYVVGAKLYGSIEVFYPQGVIVSVDNSVVAIADYDELKNSTTPNKLYPKHQVEAIVSGYDEINMWLILTKSKVID